MSSRLCSRGDDRLSIHDFSNSKRTQNPLDGQARFPACLLFLLLLACAFFSASCSRRGSAGEAGSVDFLIEAAPVNLDPRIGADSSSEHLDGLIFDSLVAHDQRLNVVPNLAQKWDTPDPLTYVFHLRHGVTFHDGRPFTSADVKYTFDSVLSGAVKTRKASSFRIVQSVDAPDPYTVMFHLRAPHASFLWDLTRPQIGIVPQGSGSTLANHPIGTGPFRFVRARQNEGVVLERNPRYFGGAADIPRVRFRVLSDANARAQELRKGTGDVTLNSLPSDMVVAFQQEPNTVTVEDQAGTTVAYVALNFADPILARREVRQALAFATDRQTLINNLLHGMAIPATSLLPANHWAYETKVMQYDYKPTQAEELLDSGGYRRAKDGLRFHLTLTTSMDQPMQALGQALAEQWKRIGVVLEVRPLDAATFSSNVAGGNFQLCAMILNGQNNDPEIFDYVFNSKKMPPDGANSGHYKNPSLDPLLDQLGVETDRQKRKALLSEIQKMLAVDEPDLMLWYLDNVCVHRNRLTNVVIPPAGDFDFLDLARLQETAE